MSKEQFSLVQPEVLEMLEKDLSKKYYQHKGNFWATSFM